MSTRPSSHRRSSRQRYRDFVRDYRLRRLDAATDASKGRKPDAPAEKSEPETLASAWRNLRGGTRRAYLREYLRWLRPHRVARRRRVRPGAGGRRAADGRAAVHAVHRRPGPAERRVGRRTRASPASIWPACLSSLVIVLSHLIGVLKDYRQRLLNVRVMLTLRQSLFDRLLHLPLPKLWDMKTGGILSRLTGDVDTTTGLLQMALMSPAVSLVRLGIAVGVLLSLNWRLALTALAIIPGVMAISFVSARRVRPIYRSLRQDAEQIDGRVGETFSGIRVVRAFGREMRELLHYMHGRHTVLRKELFAHRREMVAVDVLEPAARRRERGDRLVRRLPEHRRRRLRRRHHGLPVVHVPAAQPGVADRQFRVRAAALDRGHGTRVRGPRHGGRQARSAGRRTRPASGARDDVRGRGVRVSRGPSRGS